MQFKRNNVYFLTQSRSAYVGNKRERVAEAEDGDPIVVRLSRRAKKNLKLLQLKFLDRRGCEPDPSKVIEKLINEAAGNESDVPYPVG